MNLLVIPVTTVKFKSAFLHACVMSSEYFMRNFLYLVRLNISEWIKLLQDIYINSGKLSW